MLHYSYLHSIRFVGVSLSRWGRGQETYGEDPLVLSQIGAAYTHGLQEGSDPRYVKV